MMLRIILNLFGWMFYITVAGLPATLASAAVELNPAANRAADPALVPPLVNTNPSWAYDYKNLDFVINMGFERTSGGRLWASWQSGGGGELGFIVLATSDDEGETWSKPRVVIDPHDVKLDYPRRTLIGGLWSDPKGRLWLFFDQGMINFDGRAGVWATYCENPDDSSPRWSPPKRLWHGCAINKPIVLSNGEWLLPVALWDRLKIRRMPFQDAFRELDDVRGASVLVSSDEGVTWTRRSGINFPDPDYVEPTVIERRDGSVWLAARSKTALWEAFSSDHGRTWSEARMSEIAHVNSRHFLRRLVSGNLLLIKHGLQVDVAPRSRTDLTAFLSDDDGRTWRGGLLLDAGVSVSYPDGGQSPDGTIFISYDNERGRKAEILMTRFTEQDVLAGRFISPQSAQRLLVARGLAITVKQQEQFRAREEELRRGREAQEAAARREKETQDIVNRKK